MEILEGDLSYLSANISDEFIDKLGAKILVQIISEVKDAKYSGISIDPIPNINHIDQLTMCFKTGR